MGSLLKVSQSKMKMSAEMGFYLEALGENLLSGH